MQAVILRHRMENELSYAEVVGALELLKVDIIEELKEDDGDDTTFHI